MVANCLRGSSKSVSDTMFLTTDQLLWGLYLLSYRHSRENVKEMLPGTKLTNKAEVQDLLRDTHFAGAAYQKESSGILKALDLEPAELVHVRAQSSPSKPAFFLALDRQRSCVVLAVRGTQTTSDMLTDMHAVSAGVSDLGAAHEGMLVAAKWILETHTDMIVETCKAHPTFTLKVVGHSLGAGTAALLTLLMRNTPSLHASIPPAKITCTAVACPACMSYELGMSAASFVTTLVVEDDVIPRVSLLSLYNLQVETLETDWQVDIPEGSMKRELLDAFVLAKQAAKTRTKISSDSAKRLSNLATGVVCDKASAVATTAVRAASSAVKNYTPKTRLGSSLKNMMISHTETSTTNACEQTSSISLEILESTALEETNLSFRVRELDTDVQSEVFDGEYPMVPGSPNAPAPPIHIALFPPGRLLHCVKEDKGWSIVDVVAGVCFRRIVLSNTMLSDHKVNAYIHALETTLIKL